MINKLDCTNLQKEYLLKLTETLRLMHTHQMVKLNIKCKGSRYNIHTLLVGQKWLQLVTETLLGNTC